MKAYLQDVWEKQRLEKETDVVVKTTYLDIVPNLSCAVGTFSFLDKKAFILNISNIDIVDQKKLKKFKGVHISPQLIGNQPSLCIILQEKMLDEIFTLLISDILEELVGLSDEREAVSAIFIKINEWRRLFDKVSSEGLTPEQQIGLLGELTIINRLLDERFEPNSVIGSWNGPHGANQDFDFQGISIEIKTTRANNPSLKITNELQLDTTTLKALYIILIELNLSGKAGKTLPDLIEIIRSKIKMGNYSLRDFNTKLNQIGYFNEHDEYYKKESYEVRKFSVFEIKDNFPRLTPENQPYRSLFAISYSINIMDCQDYIIEFSELINRLWHGQDTEQ